MFTIGNTHDDAYHQYAGVLEVWHLDMLDYATIQAFAERASNELDRLDIAVLNAGVLMAQYKPSIYGNEQTLQVHVLSTTLLALLLLPKLKASKTETYTPVLELVGGSSHYLLSHLHSETEPFQSHNTPTGFVSPQNQDSVSKLFLMYAQIELAKLAFPEIMRPCDPQVYVTVVCPGSTKTDIVRNITMWYYQPLIWFYRTFIARQAEVGARNLISGICQGENAHGRFWKDDRIRE